MTADPDWTAADFRAWRERMGGAKPLSVRAAAKLLGLDAKTVQRYTGGQRSDVTDSAGDPRPVTIPRTVQLACLWLEAQRAD